MPTYKGVTYTVTIEPKKGYWDWSVRFDGGLAIASTSILLTTEDQARAQAKEVAEQAIDDGIWRNK
jgi:hypothetical protein